jgi:type I restriction enzyme S subunit
MTCQLQDIVIGIQTGPFGSQLHRSDYTETGTPVIMPQDIVDWKLSTEKIVRIPEEHVLRLQRHKVEYNDIIYPRRGDVGKCALVEKEVGWICGTGCLKVKVDPDKANPKYIFYYLQQSHIGKWIELHSTGATMMNINSSTLNTLPLDIPSLAVQNKIIAFISAYDELIENSRKQIALLEEAAQRLYREWFVDFRFPGSTSHNSHPQGWTEGVVSDIIEQSGTNTYKKLRDEYDCYVPIDVIPKKSLVYINPNSIEDAESSLVSFKKGDVLFGAMRVYFHKVCIARHNGLTRSTCFVLNVKESEYYGYATMLLFSEQFVDQANQLSSGTTMPYIKWPKFAQIPITIPSKEIALKFDKLMRPIIQQLLNLAIEIENLISARDKLLPKLMSGELKV